MAHLYAYFDESGKHKEHPIVTIGGLLDGMVRWRAFTEKWVQLLRDHQVPDFHPVKVLLSHAMACSHFPRRATYE